MFNFFYLYIYVYMNFFKIICINFRIMNMFKYKGYLFKYEYW